MDGVRLTQRDISCFKELLDLGVLTAKQLVNLSLFPNEKKARDRLRVLNQAGYVSFCPKPSFAAGRAEYVYYLNKSKLNAVGQLLGSLEDKVYLMKPSAYSPLLLHHLAINDFVISFRQAAISLGYEAKIIPEYRQLPDKSAKLKKSLSQTVIVKGKTTEIIPDGVICLNRQKIKSLLFFEIYRGTQALEGTTHSIQNKLEAYVYYWQQGLYKRYADLFAYRFKGFRVLVVVPSLSSIEKLKHICQEFAPIGLFWFALQEDIKPDTIFTPIWHVTGEEGLKAIIKRSVNL